MSNSEEKKFTSKKIPKITVLSEKDITDKDYLSFVKDPIDIFPKINLFVPNQGSDLEFHSDKILEFTVLQDYSTPGIKLAKQILLPPGKYLFSVVGFSEIGRTFFPWVRDFESKVRITETIHLTEIDEAVTVHFTLDRPCKIEVGILSHRQQIGDKCYIRSIHITTDSQNNISNPTKNEQTMRGEYIPHHNSKLKIVKDGVSVSASAYSTPGTYKLMDVNGIKILSISISVSVFYPSVAFLYVADADSGIEITSRNDIFESSKLSSPSSLLTSVRIPEKTRMVRIGILFSTSTSPVRHEMIIHELEAIEYISISDISEHFYVLNLEHESNKFSLCKRQADRMGINLTRWEAVDGNSKKNYYNWSEYMKKPWTQQDVQLNRKSIDKPGAWGYLLTMQEIIKDAILKNYDKITVFDDDFILSNSFEHKFSKLINSLPNKWDLLYLGASQWSWDGANIENLPFYHANSDTNGSFAVIYDKNTFMNLLSNIEQMLSPFDAGPLRSVVCETSLGKAFVAYPNLVIANLEKKGIRDSRNQKNYSRKFRWNLSDFPPWFTSWTNNPKIIRNDDKFNENPERLNFITAVTTFNRLPYLKNFVEQWDNTRNKNINTTLIIADDGSSDGTLTWLTDVLTIDEVKIVVIQNDGLGIARQTNSILNYILQMPPKIDLIFMCNDDINFLKNGWDITYYRATQETNLSHLVYFNPMWKKPSLDSNLVKYPMLHSSCNAREAMGCFYTLSLDIINRLGFFDEESFPIRGHSHVDYTIRACNIGENEYNNLFDIKGSNDYIGMVMRDGYVRTHRTLTLNEKILTTSKNELQKRENLLKNRDRLHIPKGW